MNPMMTREDFGKGWLLLIAQPWGRRYAQDPKLGQVQFDLYYRALGRFNVFVWVAVAEKYAASTRWPAIEDLALTLAANTPAPKQIEGPPPELAPDDYLAKRLSLAIAHTSLKEAVETVLVPFLKDPPPGTSEADRRRAHTLLREWQANGWLDRPARVSSPSQESPEKALPCPQERRSLFIQPSLPDPALNES